MAASSSDADPPKRYLALWKEYLTLCSFADAAGGARGRSTLHHLSLPPGLHTVGRLDRDSEGLLLLTDDGAFCHAVLQGGVRKRYLALVFGRPTDESLAAMAAGGLNIRGRLTRPCAVRRIDAASAATAAGAPPDPRLAGARAGGPVTWLEVTLSEGMNRQVRRMTQSAGHKTLRLVRVGVGRLNAEDLALRPGEWRYVARDAVLGDRPPATTMEAASGGCFARTTDGEKSLCQHEHTPVRL